MPVTDLTQIELTEEELRAVAGGQSHDGQSTSEAVHVAKEQALLIGSKVGPNVSFYAKQGYALPP
jgi:hypothetical protein